MTVRCSLEGHAPRRVFVCGRAHGHPGPHRLVDPFAPLPPDLLVEGFVVIA